MKINVSKKTMITTAAVAVGGLLIYKYWQNKKAMDALKAKAQADANAAAASSSGGGGGGAGRVMSPVVVQPIVLPAPPAYIPPKPPISVVANTPLTQSGGTNAGGAPVTAKDVTA